MDITYNLRINEITRLQTFNDVEDVVIKVKLYASAYAPENPTLGSGSIFVVDFSEEDFNFDSFTPYSQLTPDLIISWVLQKLNVDTVADIPMVKDVISQTQINLEREANKVIEPVYWDINLNQTQEVPTEPQPDTVPTEEIV